MKDDVRESAAESRLSAFGALRHPDFRIFWAGACLSFIGSWVQIVAMGWLVYDLTGSKQALGAIGLASGLPTTAFMLLGGVIADRANRRTLVLFTQTTFALTAFALAALTWAHQIHIWQIILISLVNGTVFAIDGPARQAMVQDLVGREDMAAGVALQSAAFNVARVIGPAVGSLLYAGFGPAMCFLVNGISFAAILIAILLIRTDLTNRGGDSFQGSVWFGFVEGLHYLRSNRLMRSVVGLTGVASICAFASYATLMPALARDRLHVGESQYGLLFSTIGIGSLLGTLLVGRSAAARKRGILMVVGANLFALSLFLLAFTTTLVVALALLFLVGAAAIAQLATAHTLTQSLAPDAMRGRAVSAHMFAMAGLQPIGSFFAGFIAERWGVSAALICGGAVFWLYTLGMMAMRPEVLRLE